MKNRKVGAGGKRDGAQRDAAQALAVEALAFLAAEPERLGRFLALTGMGPGDLRTAAREPDFLDGVLEYVTSDEPLLLAFAEHVQIKPTAVERARAELGGTWERDTP